MMVNTAYFHHFIKEYAGKGRLVVQPRMGFSDIDVMRSGLHAVKEIDAPSIGTITLDSFTRNSNFQGAADAIRKGMVLNGYPIVSYSREENRRLIEGLRAPDFPVQVRHGSPLPEEIFKATIDAGIDAIEGGPVSYCFPYGRISLKRSVEAWSTCCKLFAAAGNGMGHIESFGGCMMGQLCPPSLLIAITIAETLFMMERGIRSYSLSLAQGTHTTQDIAGLNVLRQLGRKYLGPESEWHIVFYTFMGKFPLSYQGAKAIIEESARAAVRGGAERLIVKTVKEAHQIPSITDNVNALNMCNEVAITAFAHRFLQPDIPEWTSRIYEEADFLINLLLNQHSDIGKSLMSVFKKGYWDIPFCLHPDNKRLTQAKVDVDGFIYWSDIGKVPFSPHIRKNALRKEARLSSAELLKMLSFNQQKYDSLQFSSSHG
ncbi:methylaspartate mutase [Chitinophaga sp.]|uniref:methylaspartate mutase n=1 Tax=Chitinophaga sp. TaxID=1869181 RepID=UPI0031DB3288